MNSKTHKKTLLILLLIWGIITINLIKTAYAKYITSLDASTDIQISSWNISVNNKDIISNNDISNNLSIVFPGDDYSKAGVIVPGATGYFDLNIDSSKTTVPFTVIITSNIRVNGQSYDKFMVNGYSIGEDTEVKSLGSSSEISYDISKDASSTLIRIYVSWLDAGIDSEEDTNLGISDSSITVTTNLKFSQITT